MLIDNDQKACWNLPETLRWITTRDEKRITAMWDMDEDHGIALALYGEKPQLDPRSLLFFHANRNSDLLKTSKSPHADMSLVMGPSEALCNLLKKVQSRCLWMTAIRCDGSCNERIEVPPAELNDLELRLCPDDQLPSVGLWSRSRRILVWRSPQFMRVEVIRIWPARNTKTAAASGAILRHLRQISTPEAPLTKGEAQQRCITEVPNAYPEAFKKAWAKLESSHKRGRGKHGSRAR
jgi:hypothetical protein